MRYLKKDHLMNCTNYKNNNKRYKVTISFCGFELDSFVFFINSEKQKERIKKDILNRLRLKWFRLFVNVTFKKIS